jgi:hypothetical protein
VEIQIHILSSAISLAAIAPGSPLWSSFGILSVSGHFREGLRRAMFSILIFSLLLILPFEKAKKIVKYIKISWTFLVLIAIMGLLK